MRKVYCYAKKEEKPDEIDHSGDIVKDLSSLNISDIKNRSFFFIGGEIIENPYYEPSEYMNHVYEAIDAQYEQFYRSDKDKKDAEEETSEQSPNDEMPNWIAEMPYGELIKKFPGGISEALEYAKKEKGLSVPEVHYNSPEPEKLGVKAFTKNAEVYLAPGEGEETLKHELGHVVQQKKEKIPATTKIGEQQVNLDPKREQEADEIAKHIEDHIPEIISEKPTDVKTNDVIQFELPSDDELREIIKRKAKDLNIAPHPMNEILNKAKEYYESYFTYLTSMWKLWYKNYPEACCVWALNTIKNENPTENELYLELESSVTSQNNQAEINRIAEIMDMLSTAKVFSNDRQISGDYTNLHVIMTWLSSQQRSDVKKIILELKDYCDAKGITSVLEGANANVRKDLPILKNPQNSLVDDAQKELFKEAFITRLNSMKEYIKKVYNNNEVNPDKACWIRSTGSDPHHEGKHALFLVDKISKQITGVYKAHDLRADSAVVGQDSTTPGMFSQINNLIGESFREICGRLGLNFENSSRVLATIDINTSTHVEQFMTKTTRMTSKEAELYFFRAGVLKVLSDAMAIIDLHQDNIMATSFGPLIIDAEVDFFDYSSSNLERALSQINGPGENRPSTFEILNEETNTILQSGVAWSSKPYSTRYKQGYNFMLEKIKENLIDYRARYKKLLNNIGKVRILPMSTGTFSGHLDEGIKCPKTNNENYLKKEQRTDSINSKGTRQEYASFLADEIEEKLTSDDEFKSKPFVFRSRYENNVLQAKVEDKNILTKAIKETFDNGTIIAMYADIDGNIYLDETIVAKIYLNNQKISRDKLKEKMSLKFENVVTNLQKLKLEL